MSDTVEAWKASVFLQEFNNNKKDLHHFIQNTQNLYVTFLVFLETDILLLCWFILFLLTQFPPSISRNLILSVALGLPKIQLFDLAYKLTD